MHILPEELLVDICNSMDINTLSNFVQSSWNNYRICSGVLSKRRIDFFLEKNYDLWSKDNIDGYIFINYTNRDFILEQYIFDNQVDWILPGINYKEDISPD